MRRGWLLAQLPQVMRGDKLLAALVSALEEVADTVVERVDSIEHQLDVSIAPPEHLRFVASWIGLVLDTAARSVTWHRVGYAIADVQDRMRERGLPARLVERLAYGW